MKKIKGVYGVEPRRDGELPDCYVVGYGGITNIIEREQNLGTYGIAWFDVFKGDDLVASQNAAHVSSVTYDEAAS